MLRHWIFIHFLVVSGVVAFLFP